MMLLGGQTTEFHMHQYLPFLTIAPYTTDKPHPLQMRLATAITRLEERKHLVYLEEMLSHALFAAISHCHLPVRAVCLHGGLCEHTPSNE